MKVRCTEPEEKNFTKDKIYDFTDGQITDDEGDARPIRVKHFFGSLEELNRHLYGKFEPVRYSVGDKVLIRSDLIVGTCGVYGVVPDMLRMCGKVAEIEGAYGKVYRLKDVGYNWTDEMIEKKVEEKEMKKSDLKVGYVVENRDGELSILVGTVDGDIDLTGTGQELRWLSEDLTDTADDKEADIVRVYGYPSKIEDAAKISKSGRPLLWERKEELELTIEEIAKKFGVSAEAVRIKKCEA